MKDFDQSRWQEQPSSRGWGCLGCLLWAGVGTLILMFAMCGGGYYLIFHTSIPLSQVEAVLEESGEVEIDGLSGSINSGFHVDKIRILGDGERWSELEQVDFEFNGLTDLIWKQRLIIDRFTVGGGKVYVQSLTPSDAPAAADDDHDDRPTPTKSEEPSDGLKEFRIDLLKISDLTLVNTVSGVEFKIREISLDGFHYKDEQVQKLGDIVVDADHIEFSTSASQQFPDAPPSALSRKLVGVVGAEIHEKVFQDIPFQADVLFTQQETEFHAQVWDGKLKFDVDEKQQRIEFNDFSYEQLLAWDHGLLPAEVNGVITVRTADKDERICKIAPGATFKLGDLPFTVTTRELRDDPDAKHSPPLIARHASDDAGEIVCRLFNLPAAPYLAIELTRGDQRNTRELFAEVFYDKPYDALNDEQRQRIQVTRTAVPEE